MHRNAVIPKNSEPEHHHNHDDYDHDVHQHDGGPASARLLGRSQRHFSFCKTPRRIKRRGVFVLQEKRTLTPA
jgi:hypothetical protein